MKIVGVSGFRGLWAKSGREVCGR